MSEKEKQLIAESDDMIVNGFAFIFKDNHISVVNLNKSMPQSMVINEDGKVLES